ncbi:MAG: cobalt ECF transporter T component CbiQ [Candidatus Methanoperedens sp.]|nr:cobalt ECF transporter T component CbiQ [Candidatus Methanoperedens sp.]
MFEWLTGDPLNGIVITLFFFISLIIGRYLREYKAANEKRNIEPGVMIIISFLLIIGITLMRHWYIPVIISALCIITALHRRIIRDFTGKLIFPLLLALFILLVQSLTPGGDRIDWIVPVYSDGIDYGLLIVSRVMASASVLILLVLTTSRIDILESIRWLRVPGTMIEIASFMSRYITTFFKEGKKLTMAQQARCGFSSNGFRQRIRNIASICGLLIVRASAKSDGIYKAMLSRAWKPDVKADHLPLGIWDAVIGILLASIIAGLVVIDRFI